MVRFVVFANGDCPFCKKERQFICWNVHVILTLFVLLGKVLESALRNCIECFLNSIISADFTSALIDIINDENVMFNEAITDDIDMGSIEQHIRTTHVEQSQVSIRILEWIEYNKSPQGKRVRLWFGTNMDRCAEYCKRFLYPSLYFRFPVKYKFKTDTQFILS